MSRFPIPRKVCYGWMNRLTEFWQPSRKAGGPIIKITSYLKRIKPFHATGLSILPNHIKKQQSYRKLEAIENQRFRKTAGIERLNIRQRDPNPRPLSSYAQTLNHLPKLVSLAKWLSASLQTKWLWVLVLVLPLKRKLRCCARFQQGVPRFTLQRACDMIITYGHV